MTKKTIKVLIASLLLTTSISYNSAFAVDIVGDTIPTGTDLTVVDNATVGGTLDVTGNTTLGGTLAVTGTSTLTGNTSVGGTLAVTGTSTLTGNTSVGGTLAVTGTSTLTGNTSLGGTLAVTGTSTFTGSLTANGGVSTTTLTSSGNTTLGSGSASTLTFGSSTGNSTINFNGNRLQGVADGIAATDAVNKRQLDKVETGLSRGVAGVAAMANLPAIDAGKKFNVGFGAATYNGESAGSFGFQSRVNDMTVLKVSAASSFSGGEASIGAGLGISF
jgi:hypothetical protein